MMSTAVEPSSRDDDVDPQVKEATLSPEELADLDKVLNFAVERKGFTKLDFINSSSQELAYLIGKLREMPSGEVRDILTAEINAELEKRTKRGPEGEDGPAHLMNKTANSVNLALVDQQQPLRSLEELVASAVAENRLFTDEELSSLGQRIHELPRMINTLRFTETVSKAERERLDQLYDQVMKFSRRVLDEAWEESDRRAAERRTRLDGVVASIHEFALDQVRQLPLEAFTSALQQLEGQSVSGQVQSIEADVRLFTSWSREEDRGDFVQKLEALRVATQDVARRLGEYASGLRLAVPADIIPLNAEAEAARARKIARDLRKLRDLEGRFQRAVV